MSRKLKLALFFGGRSVEHEISILTALQAYQNLNKEKYDVTPIYISKQGEFYTNPLFLELKNFKNLTSLLLSSPKITLGKKGNTAGYFNQKIIPQFHPLDVAFPVFHGSFGEDGCIQGLFESIQIPYVGFNVPGSVIGMDKSLSKLIFCQMGLPVGKYQTIRRYEWESNPDKIINQVIKTFKFPLFVKSASVGSSIGVYKVKNSKDLSFYIDSAFVYSDKILIEEAFENCIEVNCSALGYKQNVQASVCEMPISSGDILSFDDKYKKNATKNNNGLGMASLSRIIPAPINSQLTKKIQNTTIEIFRALEGCGVARVDFFVDPKKKNFWINEINTLPGSLSFYLWNKSGISFPKLLDLIISFALERFQDQQKTVYTFESGLLEQISSVGGIKGSKNG